MSMTTMMMIIMMIIDQSVLLMLLLLLPLLLLAAHGHHLHLFLFPFLHLGVVEAASRRPPLPPQPHASGHEGDDGAGKHDEPKGFIAQIFDDAVEKGGNRIKKMK